MASSIPGAVSGLITLMTAVLPADTMVFFGKPMEVYEANITLQILGVEGNQEPAEIGPSYRREERFAILCRLTSFAGDQNFPSRLTEVMNTWEIITAAIANDPHLTGTPGGTGSAQTPVRFAQCSNMIFTPEANANGMSLGCLDFEVHCQARITSLS